MKKTIFWVFEYKYNKIYENRYQIGYLSKDFKTFIIDFSKLFSSSLKREVKKNKSKKKVYTISKLKDFKKILCKNNPNYTVLNGGENFKREIEKIIRKNSTSTKIVEFYNGSLPEYIPIYYKYATLKVIFSSKIINFFPELCKFFFNIICLNFKKFLFSKKKERKYKTDILFYAGKSTLFMKNLKNKFIEKKFSSPSFDYDKFLQSYNYPKKKILSKKYAVFLDGMALHHDDFKSPDEPDAPVTKKYFEEMNNFFSIFEKKFDLKVVIALHPTCDIKNYSKFFNNRACFKNKTIELVRDSSMVLLHPATTAVSYPVIYKKPITFLITNEMNNSFTFYKWALIKQKLFRLNFLNISEIKNEEFFVNFKINKEIYNYYYFNFINSCKLKDRKKNLYDIILKNLN